jgi:hypothetical protein
MTFHPAARAACLAALTVVLALSPSARAFAANTVQIGDPVTDTVWLWTGVANAIVSLEQGLATALAPHPRAVNTPPVPNLKSAVVAAAVVAATNFPIGPQAGTSSKGDPSAAVAIEHPQSGNPTVTPTTATLAASPLAATPASSFVTQYQLNAALSALSASVRQFIESNTFSASAAPMLGGGAPNTIAAANAINQLSGVTITNANLTSSEIPDLSGQYLSLNGGTLAGALRNTATSSSYFLGPLGIGTTTPLSALSIQGALSVVDGGPSSVATLGTERTTDGNFATNPSGLWTMGSGWSWDSVNDRASYTGTGGPISLGNTQSGNNSPSTMPAISIDNGGAGYSNGDIITISGGTGDATYSATVNSSGAVTALTQISPGTAYSTTAAGTAIATTGGTGSGLTISINQIADAGALSETITTSTSDPTTSYPSRLNGSIISGPTYRVSFTIANYSGAGFVRVDIGSVAANMYPYPSYYYKSNGTYTILLTSTSSVLSFIPTADFVGAITNVSVEPVSPSGATISVNNNDGSTALEIRPGGNGNYNLNTFVGIGAGQNTTAAANVGLAFYGPGKNEGQNTALGYHALYSNTTGAENTANGTYALYSNTTGVGNTALSYDSLYSNMTGTNNTAAGVSSLWANTSGTSNTAYGTTALHFNTTGSSNTAVGNSALYYNGASNNTAFGYAALFDNTSGTGNVALGYLASQINTTGGNNTSLGNSALRFNTTGSSNTALGASALQASITASNNTAIGYRAMLDATTSQNSVAVGYKAGNGAATNDTFLGLTALGYQAGIGLANGSNYNTLLGYQAGYNVTTGADNILIGSATSSTGIANLTTGSQNILLGENESFASTTASGQLDIGNIIYGTGVTGTGSTLSKANIGIGTANPYSRLQVTGPDSASTTAFLVANSASTTEFAVYDTGNATLAGGLIQNSDQRLKTNIQSLDASSSLLLIDQLNPVTFNWIDPNKGSTIQLGFIAQQVLPIFPNLVSTTSPTALTPDGTLSLNYIDLLSPIVSAIQALSADVTSIENAITGFADSFTTNQLTFVRGQGTEIDVQKLCVGSTCITEDQLKALLASTNQSSESGSPSSGGNGAASSADDTPPVIQINGDNPAIVQVGATYNDLGATITGPQADLNLGITTFLNGALTSNIVIDTSQAATDTIDYVATDQNGLTSTSTRTIIIEAATPSPST